MPILGVVASGISGSVASSYESIATVTAGGSGAVSFTSIPSIFTHLQIRMANVKQNANEALNLTFNSDSTAVYAYHELTGDGATASAYGTSGQTKISNQYYGNTVNTTNFPSSCIMDILDYANVNKFKTTRSIWGSDFNGSGNVGFGSGLWRSTLAISTITINSVTANLQSGSTFALYGVKA